MSLFGCEDCTLFFGGPALGGVGLYLGQDRAAVFVFSALRGVQSYFFPALFLHI